MRPNDYAWRSTYDTDICERIFTCSLDTMRWAGAALLLAAIRPAL